VLGSIFDIGLIPGGRRDGSRVHNHFACYPRGDPRLISGARTDAEVFIEFDVEQTVELGNLLYSAANEVILSQDDLEPRLIKSIHTCTGALVYQRNAQWLDLRGWDEKDMTAEVFARDTVSCRHCFKNSPQEQCYVSTAAGNRWTIMRSSTLSLSLTNSARLWLCSKMLMLHKQLKWC
jgi:hypothetical protein